MKSLILICLLFSSLYINSQCNPGNNQGSITPTTVSQVTPVVNTGRPYWTFNAQAGCEYFFETCGLSTMDTYLRIYDASWNLITSNDDACGAQSSIQILFNTSGVYTVFLTRFNTNTCNTLNANAQLRYRRNCTFTDNECWGANQVCSNTSFSANTASFGTYQELNSSNQGCLFSENQSYWYYFQPVVNGTISLSISTCATCDYDFAIWQTGNCGNLGTPVRCSFAAPEGTTGIGNSAVDNSEGPGGDKWVAPLNVVAGQTYIMLVDNYSSNNESFTLDWNFSTPSLLDCNPIPLPLEIVNFDAHKSINSNLLKWRTESETSIDYFELYHSNDPSQESSWSLIKVQNASGTTFGNSYQFNHFDFRKDALNYYKLVQFDRNGKQTAYPGIKVIDNMINAKKVVKTLNIMGQEVSNETKGTIIYVYEDGTIERFLNL